MSNENTTADALRLYEVEVSVQETCFVVAESKEQAEKIAQRSGRNIIENVSPFENDVDVVGLASQKDVDRAEWTGCSPYGLPDDMRYMTCDAFLVWSAEQVEKAENERRQREEWERHPKLFDVNTETAHV